MKTVKLVDRGAWNAKDILREFLKNAPANSGGLDLEQVEQRIALRKAIAEAPGDTLTLEDAQFAHFAAALRAVRFNLADEDLHALVKQAMTPIEPTAAG